MVLWFPAYGDLEGGYVVGADGGRQKWWRRCCSRQTFATLFADHRGRCRAVWRQVWPLQVYLAAAGLFGGKFWPLQGRCKAVTLAPLLMMLLLWNILSAIFKFNVAAAVKCSLCYLQVLLFLF